MKMVSTVKSRPNHYETLGLKPTASNDEIAPAFARRMLAPRPMLDAAQIGIAYAVLRDPIKRRDYDRSLGLNAKPEPHQWTYAVQPRWVPFIAAAAPKPKDSASKAGLPEPFVAAPPKPETRAEPQLASPTAESRREPANTGASEGVPQPRLVPEQRRRPEAAAARRLDPRMSDLMAVRRARAERSRVVEDRIINWEYPALAVGFLVVTVGLLGAWAGMAAGNDAEAAQAAPATTVALPQARPRQSIAAALPAPVAAPAEPQAERPVRENVSASGGKRKASRRSTGWAGQQVREGQTGEGQADALTSDPLAPEPSAAQPAAASLPLPNRVIARTIERIGYACGQVASTVGGEAGAYKVTCTSGNSYQATPVRGRYRFRRLAD
jgi:curved DNA-binding protein CbpA